MEEEKIKLLEKKIKELEEKVLNIESIIANNTIKNFDDIEVNLDNEVINRSLDLFINPPLLKRQYGFNNYDSITTST